MHSLTEGKMASLLFLLSHIPADFRLKTCCMRLWQKVGKEKFCVCTKESGLREVPGSCIHGPMTLLTVAALTASWDSKVQMFPVIHLKYFFP